MTRITVVGAGALGCALGALLARAGQEVTLIGRPEQVAAIRAAGLRVDGACGSFTIQLPAAEGLAERPDLAILAVKTQDVLAAAEANRAYLQDVTVVALQNGVRSEDLLGTLLPRERIVSAVVYTQANYLTPGAVTIVSPGSLLIGRMGAPCGARVEAAAGLLGTAVPTRISANIQGARWLKLIVNLNNALPAATNRTIPAVFADPMLGRLAVLLMREGMAVVGRAGIRLEPLPDVSVGLARLMTLLPTGLAARVAGAKARRSAGSEQLLGSTLQSLRRGRPTEIEYLNGEIVRLGERIGVPTPLNAAVVRMVQRVEQTGRFWGTGEISESLGWRQ